MDKGRQPVVIAVLALFVAMLLAIGVTNEVAPADVRAPLAPPPSLVAAEVAPAAPREPLREVAPPAEPAAFTGSSEVVCEVVRSDATAFAGVPVQVELGEAPAVSTRIVHADAAGLVRIEVPGPTATKVTFRADSPEHSTVPVTVFTRPGLPAQRVRLRVCELDAWVRGLVTDHTDRPLAGARVSWRRDEAPTLCDAAGRFAVRVPSGREDFRCLFFAPGHRSQRENVVLSPGADVSLHVRLQPGPRVRGRIVDPAGQPVAGAAVETMLQRLTGQAVQSDADGRYELDGTLADETQVQVAVRRAGFVPAKAIVKTGNDDAVVDVTLQIAGQVHGRVSCPDGRPAAGASVRAGGSDVFGDTTETCTTDQHGAFVLDEQAPGHQQVRVSSTGFPPATATANVVRAATAVVTIVLGEGHVARGVVVDEHGQPVRGAAVMHTTAHAHSDANGRFELTGLPASTNEVDVMERDHLPLRDVDVSTQADNRLVLVRAAALQGQVVDARTGVGLDDFTVAIVGGDSMQASLGIDWVRGGRRFRGTMGQWATSGLMMTPGSTWRVRVTAPGYAACTSERSATVPAVPIVLSMTAGVTLHGTLVDANTRAALAGASLRLLDHAPGERTFDRYEPRTQSDGDGTFRFTAVAPGQVWLAIEAAGTVPRTLGPFLVDCSDLALGELRIGEGAVLAGTLRDAAGQALAGRDLHVHSLHADDRHPTSLAMRTRGDGSFEFTGLQPGTWRLFASLTGPDGLVVVDHRVQVTGGRHHVDVQPAGRGTIRGEVRGTWPTTSSPFVMVRRFDERADPAMQFSASAAVQDGAFMIGGLAPGRYDVHVFCDGDPKPRFARAAEPVLVRDGVPTPPVVLDLGAK